jgi:cell division protein FtsN
MHPFGKSRPIGALLLCAALAVSFSAAGCGKSDEDVQSAVDQALAQQKAKDDLKRVEAEQARLRREVKRLKRQRARSASSSSASTPSKPSSASQSTSSSRSQLPGFNGYVAQLGAYRYLSGAQSHRSTLIGNGIDARIVRSNLIVEFKPNLWVVYAGPYSSMSEARSVASRADGNGAPGAFARPATVR